MEIKKNPNYDLGRRSLLFFQIGMIAMLLITWQLLEWKSYDRSSIDSEFVDVSNSLDEIIPITDPIITPPPPPPAPTIVPVVIVAVEDEADIEESVIESTETNQNAEILDVEDIVEEEVEEEEIVNVPFAVIENVPVYPGCETASTNNAKKECMSQMIDEFVKSTFNTEFASELGLEGRQRIYVKFQIDKTGKVTDVHARAPHPKLEEEAVRVVKLLPKMTPGKQRGVPVGVLYALPIVFNVEI
jgi:protein TonB